MLYPLLGMRINLKMSIDEYGNDNASILVLGNFPCIPLNDNSILEVQYRLSRDGISGTRTRMCTRIFCEVSTRLMANLVLF